MRIALVLLTAVVLGGCADLGDRVTMRSNGTTYVADGDGSLVVERVDRTTTWVGSLLRADREGIEVWRTDSGAPTRHAIPVNGGLELSLLFGDRIIERQSMAFCAHEPGATTFTLEQHEPTLGVTKLSWRTAGAPPKC